MCGSDLDLRGGSRLAGRICGADLALESRWICGIDKNIDIGLG